MASVLIPICVVVVGAVCASPTLLAPVLRASSMFAIVSAQAAGNEPAASAAPASSTAPASSPLPAAPSAPSHVTLTQAQMRSSGVVVQKVLSGATPGESTSRGANEATSAVRLSGMATWPVRNLVAMTALVEGTVQEVLTTPFQKVRQGEPIARIYSRQLVELQRNYLTQLSQQKVVQGRLQRDLALEKDGLIAASRLQATKAEAMQAALATDDLRQSLRLAGVPEAALTRLAQGSRLDPVMTLVASSAGTIVEQPIAPGQRLESGTLIARIAQSDELVVELAASREQARRIRVGDRMTMAGCPGELVIEAIGAQVDQANQTLPLRARAANTDGCLKANEFVEALFTPRAPAAGSGAVNVPASALLRLGEERWVFVQAGDGFDAVRVTVEPAADGRAWIRGADRPIGPDASVAVQGIAALRGALNGFGGADG